MYITHLDPENFLDCFSIVNSGSIYYCTYLILNSQERSVENMSAYYGQPYYSLRDQYRMGSAAKKHRSGRSHRKFKPLPPEEFQGGLSQINSSDVLINLKNPNVYIQNSPPSLI